jgi:hypothetical protein
MAYNVARAERFRALTDSQLLRIAAGPTLSAAAARYELRRRGLIVVSSPKGCSLVAAET